MAWDVDAVVLKGQVDALLADAGRARRCFYWDFCGGKMSCVGLVDGMVGSQIAAKDKRQKTYHQDVS